MTIKTLSLPLVCANVPGYSLAEPSAMDEVLDFQSQRVASLLPRTPMKQPVNRSGILAQRGQGTPSQSSLAVQNINLDLQPMHRDQAHGQLGTILTVHEMVQLSDAMLKPEVQVIKGR